MSELVWTEWDIETRPRWRSSSENWDWVIYGVYWDVEVALKKVTPPEHKGHDGYFYAYGRCYVSAHEEGLFTPVGMNLVYITRGESFLAVRDLVDAIASRNPHKSWNGDPRRVVDC